MSNLLIKRILGGTLLTPMDEEEIQNCDVLREPPLIPDIDLGGPGGCSF